LTRSRGDVWARAVGGGFGDAANQIWKLDFEAAVNISEDQRIELPQGDLVQYLSEVSICPMNLAWTIRQARCGRSNVDDLLR
jgi:hypothetical protein